MTAFILESEKEVEAWLKSYMIGKMKGVHAGNLAAAIAEDTRLWEGLPEGYRRTIHNLSKNKAMKSVFAKYSNRLTPEVFLQWMLEERPDLASVIVNWPGPAGMAWLRKNMDEIKEQFAAAIV